jgi:O-antigen/teichoic acid export membrane protein
MALLRHSGIYFLARILAGGASFAIIAAYTRLLDPQAFGELALAMGAIGFFALIIVEGPTQAMLRHLPGDPRAARATTLWGLILPAVAICCVASLVLLFAAPERWRVLLGLSGALLVVTLLHRFQLAAAQGELQPGRYALLSSVESLLEVLIGVFLVWRGFGVAGALLGTTLAALAVVAADWRGWWSGWEFFDRPLGTSMLRFGLPLIGSALFIWLATFVDRWLLAAFVGTDEAGRYAAGYDLLMNLLGVPMTVMALAGIPLTIGAYAEKGEQAAQGQLRLLGVFIILILLPEAVGIVMTGPLLVNIFLGAEFRPLTLTLLPMLVSATFLKALMIYINYGYILSGRTDLTLLSIAATAGINLVLNLILIPRYGPAGAAMAALIGFGAGFAITMMKMRRVFPLPLPDPAILSGGLLGAAAMAVWLLPFHHVTAWSTALYVIPVAILIYFGAVFLFLHFTRRKPLDLLRDMWNSDGGKSATI